MNAKIAALAGVMLVALCAPLRAQPELVMIEQDGCVYCRRWHAEIGDSYGNSDYGQAAPLRVVDLHDLPEDLHPSGSVVFTPTFLLMEDGVEIARAEGYAGAELFWMQMELLSRALSADAGTDPAQ